MSVHASYVAEDDRLDLSFEGNLDVTVSRDICDICQRVAAGLKSCIVDLSRVEGIFDSGIALLQMLHRRMSAGGTSVVFVSDRPDILKWMPIITGTAYPMPSCTSA